MPVNWGPDVHPTGQVPGQSAPIANRFLGRFDGNHPTGASFLVGDWTTDYTTPGIWLCTAAGNPGTWTNIAAGGAVSSVFGRTGAVVATSGDYTAAQVTNAADKASASGQTFTGAVSSSGIVSGSVAAGTTVQIGTVGPGSASGITFHATEAGSNLYRSGVGALTIDGTLTVGGVLTGAGVATSGLTGAATSGRFVGFNASGAPGSGTFLAADVAGDLTGKLFVCTVGGTPGTWVQVGGSSAVPVGATVATSETTTSATYADLATVGPTFSFTVPASGKVIVGLSAVCSNTGASTMAMSVALSVGNTLAAADANAFLIDEGNANFQNSGSMFIPLSGLSAAATTFTAKYRTSGGTMTMKNRQLVVWPA